MRREELVMDILGGLDDSFIEEAMPRTGKYAVSDSTVAAAPITLVETGTEISKKDLRIYWITRAIGMAAVVALIVGAAVFLVQNWDKIAVSGNERPGVVTTVSDTAITSSSYEITGHEVTPRMEAAWKLTNDYMYGLLFTITGDEVKDTMKDSCGAEPSSITHFEVPEGAEEAILYIYENMPFFSYNADMGAVVSGTRGLTQVDYTIEAKSETNANTVYEDIKDKLEEMLGQPDSSDDTYCSWDVMETGICFDLRKQLNNQVKFFMYNKYISGAKDDNLFEQITDTSMPEPYPYNDHEYYKDFYYTWINRFSVVSGNLIDLPDMEKENDLINYYTLNRVGTPYTLDDNLNLYSWMIKLDLSVDNVCRAIEENNEYYSSRPFGHSEELIFNPYEIDVLKSGDRSRIAEAFATEYSIIIGDKVFNPEWLYYHTIEDYSAVGITPEEVLHKLDMYEKLELTDEAWAAFSAKLQEYADTADPFGQITDTTMPRPFPIEQDYDHVSFESQWKTKAVGAAIDCRGRENYDEWNRMCMSIRTPYRLDDNNNVAGVIKHFGITSEEIDEYFEKRNAKWQESLEKAEESGNEGAIMNCQNEIFSEEEITALKSGNDAEIIALFISDYSIWLTGSNYVISPEWLYYHTAEDYAAIGIEPQMIAAKIPLFEKTFTGTDNGEDLDEKSWELFRAKLTAYAESAKITDRLSVKTDNMPEPFSPTEFPLGCFTFYSLWQPKLFGADQIVNFDYEKHNEYRKRIEGIETPYTLYDSPNFYGMARDMELTDDEITEAIKKINEHFESATNLLDNTLYIYTEEDIAVIKNADDSAAAQHFASEYSIVVGKYAFCPKWLYYHTIDDYATAGITPEAVQNILPLYEETFTGEAAAMYANSWDVFKRKLTNYAYRETYSFRLAEITSGFDTELFEKSFYGKWEKDGGSSDDNGILLTYRDDMFTFENWIFPRGIAETDELYVMPYINSGVGECYIIKKDAPDVLYKGWWNLASYGGGSDEKDVFIINSVHDKYILADRYENDRELIPGGEIGVWGLYKLIGNSAQSAIFSQFCLETGFEKTGGFNGSGSFTDENGVVWEIAGTKSMPLMKIYYIGGDGSHDLRLAVRYYEKTEFDSFAERNYTFPEPTEHYFILSFETEMVGGAPVCNVTRSAYFLPEQDSVEVIVDDGIEEPGPTDEVTIIEDDEY